MNLKRVQSFVVLAEELHFGRAANRLNIVQPALTQHIHQLEDELGVQLFERTPRKVSLTESGRVFSIEARLAIQQMELAGKSARDAAKGLAGRLTIGFVDNAVWSVFPGIVRAFRTSFPRVELDLRQLPRAPQMAALVNGDLDIAILPGPINREDMAIHPLIQAPLNLVLPAGHPLCALSEVPIAALAQEHFVTFASAIDTRRIDELITTLCTEAGFTPILGQAVHQMHTALALVSTGFGVAIVPQWMHRAWTENIEFRPLTPTRNYELFMANMKNRERPAVKLFREASQKLLRENEKAAMS